MASANAYLEISSLRRPAGVTCLDPLIPRDELVRRGRALPGVLREVTDQDVFVEADSPSQLEPGEGVRLQVRIPSLLEFDVHATVHWVRPWQSKEGPSGVGLQVHDLTRSVRKIVSKYLAEGGTHGATREVPASLVEKYHVKCRDGKLWVWMGGILDAAESQELCRQVTRTIDDSRTGQLLAFLDAGSMKACPEESLWTFRRWFERMGRERTFVGVLHAECAVARLQMRRLAREAGIGDALVCFEDPVDATRFWQEVSEPGTSGVYSRRELR